MPGPYAHITLLHELMRPVRLNSIFSPSSGFGAALEAFFPYCALGAVSPDYPNLALSDGSAFQWADAMHCTRACEMISSGIRRIRGAKGTARDKQLAWLLGYSSHVAADVTIHPAVQARVGVYAGNQRQHRICEMNQDSFIYRRRGLGEVGESDNFALTVAQCSNSEDRSGLDRDIVTLWHGMFEDVHPELFVAHQPDSTSWHRGFVARVSGCVAAEVRLFPLAGVIAAKMGLAYPSFGAVDLQFIEEQLLPLERPLYLHYDDIFDHAACNIAELWRQLEQALCAAEATQLPMLGDWNLDTGRDEHDRLVFWEKSA
jgi:Zinc dependent phospholipase C